VNELPTEPLVLDGRNLYEPELMRSLAMTLNRLKLRPGC